MKKLVVVLFLVLAVGVAAEASSYTVGLSISTLNNPFFVDLKDGAEEAAQELGLDIFVTDAQNDSNRQLSSIEDLVSRGVDILIINPTDSTAVVPAVRLANQAGILVITVDRGSDGGEVLSHVASDNVAGGEMAGQFLAELLGGEGKVVELEGIPGTSAARDRGEGFNKALENYPGLQVVARQEAGFDRALGLTVMENILQAQGEIDGVFAHNDEMALGALNAIRASGREIQVVGFDATNDAVQAVGDGRMAATVAQQPWAMGQIAVETAYRALSGNEIEEYIPVELELVTN